MFTQAQSFPPPYLQAVAALLVDKGAMLEEYFSIGIADLGPGSTGGVRVTTLPRLVDGHTPHLAALPDFVVALAWTVNWEEETPCFDGVARVLAQFCSRLPPRNSSAGTVGAGAAAAAAGSGGGGGGGGAASAAPVVPTAATPATEHDAFSWLVGWVGPGWEGGGSGGGWVVGRARVGLWSPLP